MVLISHPTVATAEAVTVLITALHISRTSRISRPTIHHILFERHVDLHINKGMEGTDRTGELYLLHLLHSTGLAVAVQGPRVVAMAVLLHVGTSLGRLQQEVVMVVTMAVVMLVIVVVIIIPLTMDRLATAMAVMDPAEERPEDGVVETVIDLASYVIHILLFLDCRMYL